MQTLLNSLLYFLKYLLPVLLSEHQQIFYFLIGNRIKVLYRKILKFFFYRTDTKPVRYGSINLKSFKRFIALFLLRHSVYCAHIVQTVG